MHDAERCTCTEALLLFILVTETLGIGERNHLLETHLQPVVNLVIYIETATITLKLRTLYSTICLIVTEACKELCLLVTS